MTSLVSFGKAFLMSTFSCHDGKKQINGPINMHSMCRMLAEFFDEKLIAFGRFAVRSVARCNAESFTFTMSASSVPLSC